MRKAAATKLKMCAESKKKLVHFKGIPASSWDTGEEKAFWRKSKAAIEEEKEECIPAALPVKPCFRMNFVAKPITAKHKPVSRDLELGQWMGCLLEKQEGPRKLFIRLKGQENDFGRGFSSKQIADLNQRGNQGLQREDYVLAPYGRSLFRGKIAADTEEKWFHVYLIDLGFTVEAERNACFPLPLALASSPVDLIVCSLRPGILIDKIHDPDKLRSIIGRIQSEVVNWEVRFHAMESCTETGEPLWSCSIRGQERPGGRFRSLRDEIQREIRDDPEYQQDGVYDYEDDSDSALEAFNYYKY